MRYFDSHLHFDGLATPAEAAVARAREAGVDRMIAIGGDADANAAALLVAERFPDCVRAAIGFDRGCAGGDFSVPAVEALVVRWKGQVAAVGETGLDYHYHPETAALQRELFAAMLALAGRHRLPVVVHSRDADEDTLAMLAAHAAAWKGEPDRVGVLHCCTRGDTFVRAVQALGYRISFSGILSFRNAADLRTVAAGVPDEALLVETDAPYLAPVPLRGRPNEPAFVPHVVAALAAARGQTPERVAETTWRNASRLFGWAAPVA